MNGFLLIGLAFLWGLRAETWAAESPSEALLQDYVQNLRLLGRKEPEAAIAGFQRLIARHPDFDRAYRRLVDAYEAKKSWGPAEAYFNALLNQNPESPYAYYGLGLIRQAQRDDLKAAE